MKLLRSGELIDFPRVEAFMLELIALWKRHGLYFHTGPMGDEPSIRPHDYEASLFEDGTFSIDVDPRCMNLGQAPDGIEPPGRKPITGGALVVTVETFNTMNHEEVFAQLVALAESLSIPGRNTILVKTRYAGLEISATAGDTVSSLVSDLERRLSEGGRP